MALQFSTGLKNGLLDTDDFKSLFEADGFITVYAGTIPADADAALDVGNTAIVTYSNEGNSPGVGEGLTLDPAGAASGAISKNPGQNWQGAAGADAVGTFFRWYQLGDSGLLSTTELRIQGTIGGAGADLFVQSTSFTNAQTYTIDYFSLTIPL